MNLKMDDEANDLAHISISPQKYNIGIAFLRILMSFEVVMCHFKSGGIITKDSIIYYMYELREMAVPVFMIMAFSLSDVIKMAEDHQVIKHRMYRLITPQVIWSVVYFSVYFVIEKISNINLMHEKADLLWQLFLGHSINQTAWYQIVLIWLTIIFVAIFHSTTRKRGEVIIL